MSDKEKILPIDTTKTLGPKITKKALPPYFLIALGVLPIFAAGMAFWAMLNLQSSDSFPDFLKAAMVAITAGGVSYCINRFAVDWGTELAAAGFISAGVFSVSSILAVGACLFAFTYAGIVLPDVRQLRLEDHGHALVGYFDGRNTQAAKTMRIVPVVKAVNSDLSYHAKCEVRNSCISGKGIGGRGSIARILEAKAVRAGDIARQIEQGTKLLGSTISQINNLVDDYQAKLNETDKTIVQRRQALIKIDAKIGQAITTLNEAVPVPLLLAYADELNQGLNIPNRPAASGAVNALLRKHGQALKSVIATLENDNIERPAFPVKAGIGTTFSYLGHFAAIAGVIWVAEGIFPLALWIYTLLFLIRQRDLADRPSPNAPAAVATEAQHEGENLTPLPHARNRRRGGRKNLHHLNGGGHAK